MRSAVVFGARITNWELTNTNLKPHLAEMPQVQPLQLELEGVIAEGRDLDRRQEVARSQVQDLIHQRQDLEKRGEALRRRIAAHLRGTFGFTSDQLVQFGVNPRPRVIRRKKTDTQKPGETPPPQQSAAK